MYNFRFAFYLLGAGRGAAPAPVFFFSRSGSKGPKTCGSGSPALFKKNITVNQEFVIENLYVYIL